MMNKMGRNTNKIRKRRIKINIDKKIYNFINEKKGHSFSQKLEDYMNDLTETTKPQTRAELIQKITQAQKKIYDALNELLAIRMKAKHDKKIQALQLDLNIMKGDWDNKIKEEAQEYPALRDQIIQKTTAILKKLAEKYELELEDIILVLETNYQIETHEEELKKVTKKGE